jgi:hypothetical protein
LNDLETPLYPTAQTIAAPGFGGYRHQPAGRACRSNAG